MKALSELGISNPPWSVWHVSKSRVKNANGNSIADCGGLIDYIVADAKINEAISNARLIAAAPELYECLRDAVEDMEEINCDPDGCSSCLLRDDCKIQNYRYVLAKASGEEVAKAAKESEAK